MLSRIANNLYWAGRNLERLEHVARFIPVNYFSSLDGPEALDAQHMLRALNAMAGDLPVDQPIEERDLLFNIAFDEKNYSSVISCAHLTRENCRGSRDLLSTELWEEINGLYHYVQDFDEERYLGTSMSEFMVGLQGHVLSCKAQVDSSLIKNQVWSTLKLGLLLERSFQISRIIQIKLNDLEFLKNEKEILQDYESEVLLKCLQAFDMNRKYYRKPVNQERALEFLIFNEKFPRSLAYCLSKVCIYLKDLSLDEKGSKLSVRMIAEHLKNQLIFGSMDDLKRDPKKYMAGIQSEIAKMNQILVSHYFD
jgi:uncharacterized alpha-E superfamily protein